MIEKVNPQHPDKIADRIAGTLVDYCYTQEAYPKCAFEVLIGHRKVAIIAETSTPVSAEVVLNIVSRITGMKDFDLNYTNVPQDKILNQNQQKIRCGDNGIFKGMPISKEVKELSDIARKIYSKYPKDGKYILADNKLIVCQSNAKDDDIKAMFQDKDIIINPLGYWTGGTDVDTGATNRKLGSDMGEAITGGGLHGKDLSKADVSVNIYAHLKAQETGDIVNLYCAIGDEYIDGNEYSKIVGIARDYVNKLGGFEKLAEWGIV